MYKDQFFHGFYSWAATVFSLYSVRMRENADQNFFGYGHFSRSVYNVTAFDNGSDLKQFFSFSTINHITVSSVSPSPSQTSMIKMDGISFRHRVYVYDWDIGLLTIVPKSSPWLDSEPSFRVCWSCFDYICCSSRRCKYHREL